MRKLRRQKRSYRRVIALFVFLCVVLTGTFGYMYWTKHKTGAAAGSISGGNSIHIMILGVDRRADDVGRSDTLMVATLDPEKETASLLSVPRDTRVKIEGHGYDKINHAYAFGGHDLTKKTVENLLGIKMDYYVLIDLKAFARIIDAIGGVDINVEKRMHYEDPYDDNGGLVIDLYPGEQHMDGKKAIQYVRYRDGEGDIGRINRQQKFMKAVLDELLTPQILPKLPSIIEEISKAVETDLPLKEMLSYSTLLKKVHDTGLATEMVPGKPAYLEDISYWLPDMPALRALVAKQMGVTFTVAMQSDAADAAKAYENDIPKDIKVVEDSNKTGDASNTADASKEKTAAPAKPNEISVLVINSSGINGAGAEVADILSQKGFIISGVETGETSSREQTTITTDKQNTDLFYGMPFPCTIMSGGDSGQAVVNIGLDYNSK